MITDTNTISGASATRDVAGSRVTAAAHTVGIGGTIAAVTTYYLQPPPEIYAHVVALIIFTWNTCARVATVFWRRRFNGHRKA